MSIATKKRILSELCSPSCSSIVKISEEFNLIFGDSSDSSDSDSSDSSQPRRKLQRMRDFINTVNLYDDFKFKEHFRLKRQTCQYLINKIKEDNVLPQHKFGREKISSEKAFLLTLWYLTNTETFRQVSERFDCTKSSAHRMISKIINYLVCHSKNYILWPNANEKLIMKKVFKKNNGIDGIIGVIGVSHIAIKKPDSRYAPDYYNRNGGYSILIQAICDHNKKFTDFSCGDPGSLHDAQLLKKSSIYMKHSNGFFNDDFLIGGSSYPCLPWLLPPFKDNGSLSKNQKLFNYRHSSTRTVIENAFALLKTRFRRLKFFENTDLRFIVKCVTACAVLHNICIDFGDNIEAEAEQDSHQDFSEDLIDNISGITPIYTKRDDVYHKMFNEHV